MLKHEFRWAVVLITGLFVASSSLLLAAPQDAQGRDDIAITTSIQAKLFQDPSLKTLDIQVSTQNGVVTLTGTVDTQDQQAAVDRIASMEPGVVKVIDSLNVNASAPEASPSVEDSQNEPSQPADTPPQASDEPSQPGRQTQSFGSDEAQGQAVPATLHLSSGTMVSVRLNQGLTTDQNRSGDAFTATLDQPVVVNGWVVARRGQTVEGRVLNAVKAGRVRGTSKLQIALTRLTLVDGEQLPVQTTLVQASGGTSRGRDASAIGTTTGVGAAIGAIAGEGGGAAIGAGIGAAVGVAGVLLTRGRPTVIPPEALLTFRLETSAEISTLQGQAAFRPVNQQDYPQDSLQRRPYRRYPPRPPYGYPGYFGYYGYPGYYSPYWGWGRPYGYWGPGFVFNYHSGYGRHHGYRH
ncbi:MAG: BON domain-containing protein [Acidobacteria bacterium]|nr:MAG: BON domain-containing protein [Acidobacteriota bacterium]